MSLLAGSNVSLLVGPGVISGLRLILPGVFQGCVPGLLLFLVYKSDLLVGLESKMAQYAGGASVVGAVKSQQIRIQVANSLSCHL